MLRNSSALNDVSENMIVYEDKHEKRRIKWNIDV